jgi:ADP-ribose pyrophosphatase
MALPLFVFGTLRDAGLRRAVAGGELPGLPAVLPGHAVARALDTLGVPQPFPILVAREGEGAQGLLLRPDVNQQTRLDIYEQLFHYVPQSATVVCDGQPVAAQIYLAQDDCWAAGPEWDLDAWADDWAFIRTRAAAEIMALWPQTPIETLRRRYPMIEAAAASAHRARTEGAPAALRRSPGPADVVSSATRRPYAQYFGVREDDLCFRRFDGTMSAPVTRAGFVMGDAVTVLPYDPVTDRVLVVEQFRYGPWLRGDPNPWVLEPIAGRIDPGETPQDAARRESAEEASLVLDALHLIGGHYPSPGAVTEYVLAYVAIARLGPGNEGVGGLPDEAEDIRAHVIGFHRLMALVADGEVRNGPLLVSALWLAANRDRLRHTVA